MYYFVTYFVWNPREPTTGYCEEALLILFTSNEVYVSIRKQGEVNSWFVDYLVFEE